MSHALPSLELWFCHKYDTLLNWWDTLISCDQRSVLSHTCSSLDLPGGGGGRGCGRRGRLGCFGESGELPLLCGEIWGGCGLMTSNKKTLMKTLTFRQCCFNCRVIQRYIIWVQDHASIKSRAVMAYFKALYWQNQSVSTVCNEGYSITTRRFL